ncbi:hypothetical protein EDD21DRAFT_156603 [Dissophora ornata]|nr:hypothetical protein EDD21DRAFT_156603 [Dissophora ornata]
MNATQPQPLQQPQESAQQRVFALPELRDHIGFFLSPTDIRPCTLVSKQWHQDWTPIYWKDIQHVCPWNLASFGHLVQHLDLRRTTSFLRTATTFKHLTVIQRHCQNLRSLKLMDFIIEPAEFKAFVMGISTTSAAAADSSSTVSKETDLTTGITSGYTDTMARNGYLSNSLQLLELHFPPDSCALILPWLIQAKRAGQLQQLRSFCIGEDHRLHLYQHG